MNSSVVLPCPITGGRRVLCLSFSHRSRVRSVFDQRMPTDAASDVVHVTLHFGRATTSLSRTHTLHLGDALRRADVGGSAALVARHWCDRFGRRVRFCWLTRFGSHRAKQLLSHAAATLSAAALPQAQLAIGRRFGIVTPNASLIVLGARVFRYVVRPLIVERRQIGAVRQARHCAAAQSAQARRRIRATHRRSACARPQTARTTRASDAVVSLVVFSCAYLKRDRQKTSTRCGSAASRGGTAHRRRPRWCLPRRCACVVVAVFFLR